MNMFLDFLECVEACFESSNYQYYKDHNLLYLQGHHSHWRIHILQQFNESGMSLIYNKNKRGFKALRKTICYYL